MLVNSFVTSCKKKKRSRSTSKDDTSIDDDDWESEESEDDTLHGALLKRNAAPKKMTDQQLFDMFPIGDDLKMMLVVREDLKMGKGKIGA